MKNVCVLDFETTGFSPEDSDVVEFACVRIRNAEPGLNLASLCRPLVPITYGAMRVHGITNEMVADKPTFHELLPTLLGFIGGDTVICHNTPFDMGFLLRYCRQAGIDFRPETEDTLVLARRLFPRLPSKSLQPLAEYLGVSSAGYHRALADAMATARVYLKMMEIING